MNLPHDAKWNGCYTLDMAAAHLGVGIKHIRRLLNRGDLDGYKLQSTRWQPDDLVTWASIEWWDARRHARRTMSSPLAVFADGSCQRCGILLPLDDDGYCALCRHKLAVGREVFYPPLATLPACKAGRVNGGG